jgi:hypothetical protein
MADMPNALLQTTDVYDVDVIEGLDVNSKDFKEFLVRLRQSINNIALSLNSRDGGYYGIGEFNAGMQYFPDPNDPTALYRTVTRTVVNFGTLPNNTTKSVAHGINTPTGVTSSYIFTHIYACATDTTTPTAFPIPAHDTSGNTTYISVDATNVSITTNWNATAYTECLVVIEYIVN